LPVRQGYQALIVGVELSGEQDRFTLRGIGVGEADELAQARPAVPVLGQESDLRESFSL